MRGKIVFALVIMLSLAFLGTMGIKRVSAWSPTEGQAAVYVTWSLTSYVEVGSRVGVWNPSLYNYAFAIIKVYLPHKTCEPVATSDMTWQGRVDISWDPTVLNLTSAELWRPPLWSKTDPTTPGLWSQFNTWVYRTMPPPAGWYSSGSYSVSYIPIVDTEAGTASITTGLLAPSPTGTALPAMTSACPDYGYHNGSYYDLPYTPNTIWNGGHVANKGIYEDHVWLGFMVLKDGPSDYSKIDITFVRFLTYGGNEISVETVPGWYGVKIEPEFPLGPGLMMLLVPAIPIVYLWRTRKRVKR